MSQEKQQALTERLGKLEQAGVIDQLTILKMRLDLVTTLLVPDSLVPTLEDAWEGLMEKFVEQAEQAVARQTLLEGVRPT
jgi:hypothetical protein